MLAQDTESPPINALTLEDIQKHLESAAVEPFSDPLQWSCQQNAVQTLAETIQQMKQAQARLTPEQSQETAHHLTASIDALRELKAVKLDGPATPEQKASFDLAWLHLEKARVSLCATAYERMRPLIGTIAGPPDLSSRPYLRKHGLWPKDYQYQTSTQTQP